MLLRSRLPVYVLVGLSVLIGCAGTPAYSQSQGIIVENIDPNASTKPVLQYQQLGIELMRYADRYSARMVLEADRISQQASTPDERRIAAMWKLASETAAYDIAVGSNYVENLLDMIVLASLTRIQVENYWVPELLGYELGQGLFKAALLLEDEIWEISNDVLTPEHQKDLKSLILDWHQANADQHYFWTVRFAGFTDQRAIDLQRASQKSGLLGQISQTRETADEIRLFGERLLYYLQRAPDLTRLQTELGLINAVSMPEVVQLLDNTERLTRSTERYADMIEQLPAERDAAIAQMIDVVSREREAAITQMFDRLSQEREQAITQMFDQFSRERQDAITQIAIQERDTIKELLMSTELKNAVEHIGSEGGEIVNTTFIRGALLILLWLIAYVGAKLAYDAFKRRSQAKQEP